MEDYSNLKLGDKFHKNSSCMRHIWKKVLNSYPVKYNGITDDYIVCIPSEAQYTAIIGMDEDGKQEIIYLEIGDNNSYILADII